MSASTQSLASMGRGGDTELAHVKPQEKAMLIKMGGSGTTNPKTGLKEYNWLPWSHSHSNPLPIPKVKVTVPKITVPTVTDVTEAINEGLESISDAETATQDALDALEEDVQQEAEDVIEEHYQGGDVDQVLELGQYAWNEVDKLRKGETTQTEETVTETTEAIKKIPKAIGETAEEIGAAGTETYQTGMETAAQAGINAGTQVTQAKDDLVQALVAAGLITMNDDDDGPGNAQAILEGDPRMLSLLTRRRQARKRGKAQLRKGGGLYIPLKTGIQVPVA